MLQDDSSSWNVPDSRVDHGCVAVQLGPLDEPPRPLERSVGRAGVVEEDGSDRRSDPPWASVDPERAGREKQAKTLGEVGELGPLDVRREHDELLPTPAEQEVAGAQLAA